MAQAVGQGGEAHAAQDVAGFHVAPPLRQPPAAQGVGRAVQYHGQADAGRARITFQTIGVRRQKGVGQGPRITRQKMQARRAARIAFDQPQPVVRVVAQVAGDLTGQAAAFDQMLGDVAQASGRGRRQRLKM